MGKKPINHGPTQHVEVVGPWLPLPQSVQKMQDDINARLASVPMVPGPESDDPDDSAYPIDVRIAPFGDKLVCVLTYRLLEI